MRLATLLFLIKTKDGRVTDICLAYKKKGFGMNRWNGVGGKVEENESIENATIREAKEEIFVDVSKKDIKKNAELTFIFSENPEWNQIVHVYFTEKWQGEIKESQEMKPEWFSIEKIPFDSMWPDDRYWLPEVLKEKKVNARFVFGKNDIIEDKKVEILNKDIK